MFGDTSSESSTSADIPGNLAPPARSGPSVTLVLIGLNVLVYVAMVVSGVSPLSPTPKEVIPWGAGFGPLTLNGQWWRLLSECFLHFGLVHLAVNMYIFFRVGPLTEVLFGRLRFLLLYLLAGLGGSIVSLYIHPLSASAGASGAIFGVYGGLLAFLLFRRGILPPSTVQSIAVSALIFLGYNFIYGLADLKTDFSAHLGGLFTGFLAGALLVPARRYVAPRFAGVRTIAVAVGGLVLAVVAVVFIARTRHPQDKFLTQVMLSPSVPLGTRGRIVYSGAATLADANALATGWRNLGFDPDALLLLSRDAQGPSLSFQVGKDESDYKPLRLQTSQLVHGKDVISYSEGPAPPLPWNDLKVLASFRVTGVSVAPLLGGPPFRIILLNNQGEPRKTLNIVERVATIGSADRIWYSGAITSQNVQDTGRTLQSIGYFHDKGALVLLSRAPASTEISFVCAEGSWDNPKTVVAFQSLGHRLAQSLGGPPLTIHLVDATFQPRKTLAVP